MPSSRVAAAATILPSGDQETALRTSNAGASGRMFVPFAFIR